MSASVIKFVTLDTFIKYLTYLFTYLINLAHIPNPKIQ